MCIDQHSYLQKAHPLKQALCYILIAIRVCAFLFTVGYCRPGKIQNHHNSLLQKRQWNLDNLWHHWQSKLNITPPPNIWSFYNSKWNFNILQQTDFVHFYEYIQNDIHVYVNKNRMMILQKIDLNRQFKYYFIFKRNAGLIVIRTSPFAGFFQKRLQMAGRYWSLLQWKGLQSFGGKQSRFTPKESGRLRRS